MTARRSAELFPQDLRLAQPLVTGAGVIDTRHSLLLRVVDRDGLVGWGEAAPLPGWPGAGLDDTRTQLNEWIAGGATPQRGTARAAVEMAALDIEAQRAGVPVADLLAPDAASSVEVNALLDHTQVDQLANAATRAVANGFEVLKVKVGSHGDDVARVRSVREAAPSAKIRLDANRAYSVSAAVDFCAAVADWDIEFIEEPVAGGVAALQRLQRSVGVDVAADESLSEIAVDELSEVDLPVLVIKPSAIGGYRNLVDLAGDRRVVVTSFLDSAVGVAAALHLAAAMPEPRMASGLATATRFAVDTAELAAVANGRLRVPGGPGLGVVPHAGRGE